jgi:chemotaxis signal transduction protein
MPDFIRGVINLRGAVVPVIDLSAGFGKASAPSFGTNIRTDFIAGMGKVNGKFVIILNIPMCCRWVIWPRWLWRVLLRWNDTRFLL